MMLRWLYTALWHLALPVAWLRLLWRSRHEPGYRQHVGERFGRYGRQTLAQDRCLWVHAVSVGETRAAQPLIEALLTRFPDHAIVLTHMTPTGRRTGAELFAAEPRVHECYLPYDVPWAIRGFLRHFRPELGLVMETEIWPNVVHGCRRAGVPLCLVNARMSPRSYRRTLRLGRAAREVFAGFTRILAQTPGDAERYRALGVPQVEVTGNLKFDMTPPPALQDKGAALQAALAHDGRAVWCAGSTREGEEALLLAAWRQQTESTGHRPALILVPRHPQRFDAVAELVTQAGFTLQRRSALADWPERIDAEVLLGDSMGEMTMYFSAAGLAFIGGSLLPLGGQNLIEACAVGTPVLVGPHTFNFAQATEDAIAAGACLRVPDAGALARAVQALLADPADLQARREAATLFAGAHRGATDRTVDALAALVPVR